jgi:hypothetical protein
MDVLKGRVVIVALSIAVAASLFAQTGGVQQNSYTAEFKVSRERTLADGSTDVERLTEVRARDSQHRLFISAATAPEAGRSPSVTQVLVFDSVARNYLSWSVPGDRVVITPLLDLDELSRICASKEPIGSRPSAPKAVSKPKNVDLGKDTIAGVEARGSREIKTIYVEGSSGLRKVTHTREVWTTTDPSLGLFFVKIVIDDPGIEKFTEELDHFEPYEPYPTMFQPPQGYEIVSRPADQAPCPPVLEPDLLKPPAW